MDLDTRGRQAAAGVRQRVAAAELPLAAPPTARVAGGLHPAWSLAAGAVAAVVLMMGIWMVRPTVVADEANEVITAVTSTTAVTESTAPTTAPAPQPLPGITDPPPATAPPATVDIIPPSIEITAPADGQVFETKTITFAGITEPGARVLAGPYEATVDEAGNWSIVLVLSPGTNRATFVAIDAAGNQASATVSPVYEPPAPKVEDRAAFVAYKTFGECSESPPYDVYHGKGEPGSTVTVTSEFGAGTTTVGPAGVWELRVEFPTAPAGKVFAVKVKDSLGRSATFEFVYTGT